MNYQTAPDIIPLPTSQPPPPTATSMGPFDVLAIVLGRWKLIALCTVLGVALGAVYLHVAGQQYLATVTLVPFDEGSSDATAFAGPTASLLLGLRPPEKRKTELYQATLYSVQMATRLDEKYGMRKRLFLDQWDEDHKTWHRPSGVVSAIKAALKWLLGMPAWMPPSAQQVADVIRSIVSVRRVNNGETVDVEVTSSDPQFALWLLRTLDDETEKMLIAREGAILDEQIGTLTQLLDRTTAMDLRQMLVGLLTRIRGKRLLVSEKLPYAYEMVDPPRVTDRSVYPNARTVLLIALLNGAILGIVISLTGHALGNWKRSR